MITFTQFIKLKEALSLDDPLAQSILKVELKRPHAIYFRFTFDENNYLISIYNFPTDIEIATKPITIQNQQQKILLDVFNLMSINLKSDQKGYLLTNKMGMKANTIYNMLLNAIKQAHDHFGENNIIGYKFSGAQSEQDIMYDRLMKRFSPNLITWSSENGIYLKPEAVQKLKDQNPHMIKEINDQIHQATSQKELEIQQAKQFKLQNRSLGLQP